MKSPNLLALALAATTLAAITFSAPAQAHRHNYNQDYLNQLALQQIYNQRLSEQLATQHQQAIWYQSQAAQYGNPYGYGGYGHNVYPSAPYGYYGNPGAGMYGAQPYFGMNHYFRQH
jgi:hypothetical protein